MRGSIDDATPEEWDAARAADHAGETDELRTWADDYVAKAEAEKAEVAAQRVRAKLTSKDTNPKDACGVVKTPYSTISAAVMAEVGVAMLEGALKYGRHNYRIAGVRASVYYDAIVARHLARWWEGEDIDAESNLHHVTKAIAGLTVLRDSMIQGNWVDDRPPKSPDGWQDALDVKVKELLAKYPEPKPAATAKEVG